MEHFQVWLQGYSATGNKKKASFKGVIEAETFAKACEKWANSTPEPHFFDPKNVTYWGCRFFDNEADARKVFG